MNSTNVESERYSNYFNPIPDMSNARWYFPEETEQICPWLNANEIQIPYDKHQKVSSLVKRHQNTHNSVKYEVIWKCQITLPNMK